MKDYYFIDLLAELLGSMPAREMSRKTGLSREKVRRIAGSNSFVLDWKLLSALNVLGYRITLIKIKEKDRTL